MTSDGKYYNEHTDYEEVVRLMIWRENEVINNRMIWLAALHGLLFTSLGFAWDKQDSRGIIYVFCCLGVLVSGITAHALWFASLAQRRLLRWWDKHAPDNYNGPGVIGLAVKKSQYKWMGLSPWGIMAICFGFSWIAVFIINSRRS